MANLQSAADIRVACAELNDRMRPLLKLAQGGHPINEGTLCKHVEVLLMLVDQLAGRIAMLEYEAPTSPGVPMAVSLADAVAQAKLQLDSAAHAGYAKATCTCGVDMFRRNEHHPSCAWAPTSTESGER